MIQTISPYKIEFLQDLQPNRKQFVRFASCKTAKKRQYDLSLEFFYNRHIPFSPNCRKHNYRRHLDRRRHKKIPAHFHARESFNSLY